VQLITFGKVKLEGLGFSRPKPLLLLAYLTLEGAQTRDTLAELFWSDKKAKSNLSVVLSQFKKEGAGDVIASQPGIDPLPSLIRCDAQAFLELLAEQNLQAALELYKAPFLHDLGKPLDDLEVSSELRDWVFLKREWFAQQAQVAMLALAESNLSEDRIQTARALAEWAYQLSEAPELEPVNLARLQRLLSKTNSDLNKNLERSLKAGIEDLAPKQRSVFLALSLQPQPNLSIIRNALEFTLNELAEAQETLLMAGLIDTNARVLTPELASSWLENHPSERSPLVIAMARATPPEDAFLLYNRIYRDTQGFGGLGDMAKARTAYCNQAQKYMDQLEFAKVITLLEEVRSAERVTGIDPEPESTFLYAYALERSGRFKEALEVVQNLAILRQTSRIMALKSGLLWRAGKTVEAQLTAESVLNNGSGDLWAKATAYNTIGCVSSSGAEYSEAISSFKKAAGFYEAVGDQHRWIGALNNQATDLGKMADNVQRLNEPKEMVESILLEAENTYKTALEGLTKLEIGNLPLEGRILSNLGKISETREDWIQAEHYYQHAESVVENVGMTDLSARLKLNLGTVYQRTGRIVEAERHYREALKKASAVGELAIQALAMNNIGHLKNDLDQIELSFELLEQVGDVDSLKQSLQNYKVILKEQLEQALGQHDFKRTHRILERLKKLHERLEHDELALRVETAIEQIRAKSATSLELNLSDLFRDLDFEQMSQIA
jgi:DNA-binding SARP family transcriptional activator